MRPDYRSYPIDAKRIRSLALRFGALILLAVLLFESVSLYVENLWFESLGYASAFWYRLGAQAMVFLIFAAATTGLLWLLFRLVQPSGTDYRRRITMEIGGETIVMPSAESLRGVALPAAVLLGVLFGFWFAANWSAFALFFNQPSEAGAADPILGRSLSFYLFTLPVLQSIAGWFLTLSVIGLIAGVLLALVDVYGSLKSVSAALGIALLAAAFWTYIRRFSLMFGEHSLFSGVRYVDDHAILPGLLAVVAALAAGAVIAFNNMRSGRLAPLGVALAAPFVTYVVVGLLAPAYVTTFIVRPNELVRETPYIRHNIEFTRKAFGIDSVEEIPFEPRVADTAFDPERHAATLENIRLWDWRALRSTLEQIQEIRTYYTFADVDVDRYIIDGRPQAMMLAARELNLNNLPAGSRNWVNERLIYTHGYGVTMNPVSQFTREGQPRLVLSNMPVESAHPDVRVTRPEIYFGELTNWPVYAKTRQKEFNFPGGESNNYANYEGSGGIRMGSFLRQLLLAVSVGDITRVPFSDDITADSVLLMRRNIRERATTLAPFLHYDDDPYIVVGDDGRLYWIMDAFTMTDRYPYARSLRIGGRRINYLRNSVKTVIDAYNGTVDFYVFDPADPLIQAYQRMFPDLFKPSSAMPPFLQQHVRYPELLLQAQAMMYATYHVEDEQVFYNREDVWSIAEQGRTQTGEQASDVIEPFFILMQFPGETRLEFVSILPFTPGNRNNLIGWIAARSDGDAYGKLRAYQFPKSRFVDGPLQIQARIDQDPQLSSQFTLWNQQGSTVIRGNLLVLPLEDVLLYAEPVYLQAERSPMPELRLVVLATQDRLVYAPRFPEALAQLTGDRTPPAVQTASTPAPPPAAGQPQPPEIRQRLDRAARALADYQRLTAEGKHGEAGQKLDELKKILEEAQ